MKLVIRMKKFNLLTVVFYFITIVSMHAQMLNDTLKIDEVVITGSRVDVSRRNLPVNVSVINQSQIDEVYESSILPMISRSIPGLFVTERGGTGFGRTGSTSAGNITIRGVGGSPNSQVLVLVDGHPQFMGLFGHPFPNSYVASDLQRVEVIRGPASILYGSNAMGGVLNFISREQKKEGLSGSARIQYGSFNTQKYMASSGFRKGKFNMFISYNHDQSDGHRDSMGFNIDNAYIKAGYKLNQHFKLNGDFNLADSRSYDPGREGELSPVFMADMLRGKASVSLLNKYDKVEGGLLAYYNYGDHSFSDGWMSHDEIYGLSFYQVIRLLPGSHLTLGTDYKRSGGKGNKAFPPTFANQWLTQDETAGYIIVRQDIKDALSLTAGLRLEDNSLAGTELVPQLGLSWHLNTSTDLKASVSKGFRNPTLTELFLFSPNPKLNPESLMSYEVSVLREMLDGKLKSELSLFYMEGDNLIQIAPNPSPPPMFSRFNSGRFSHKGLEIEADYIPWSALSVNLSYSYLYMDIPKIGAPAHQVNLSAHYKFNSFTMTVQSNYIGELYTSVKGTEGVNAVNKENYFLLNASLKYNPTEFVELYISGKNLSDTRYEVDYGYPLPGISFLIGCGVKF